MLKKITDFFSTKSSPVNSNIKTKANGNPYEDHQLFSSLVNSKHAGVDVTYNSAMRQQDVYTCIRIKSESIGQLPVRLYRKLSNGLNQEITSGREYNIFTQKPNDYQTWQEFIEQYVTTIETIGNFYAYVNWNRYDNVTEIIPFKDQNACRPDMDANGNVFYTYAKNDGRGGITSRTYGSKEILHIKLNTRNGYLGLSPITQSAMTIGSAIAGDTHASALFENGAQPSGILSTEGTLGDDNDEAEENIQRIKRQFNELYKGPQNSGKTAVLEFGLSYQTIQMSAVDAQLIEQRKYSREQIASIFRVPLHMLGSPDGMKYNTIEQTSTGFFRDALMPLVTRLENQINLIVPASHFIKLYEREYTRGDRKALVDTIGKELEMGACSLGEAQVDLGRNVTDENFEIYVIGTNNRTWGTWAQQKQITDATIANMENEGKQENSVSRVAPGQEENATVGGEQNV